MRNFSNRVGKAISLLAVVATMLVLGGCSMTADSTLGSNIMPEEQVMEMRHLKFQGNKIIRLNTATGQNEVVDGALAGKNYL